MDSQEELEEVDLVSFEFQKQDQNQEQQVTASSPPNGGYPGQGFSFVLPIRLAPQRTPQDDDLTANSNTQPTDADPTATPTPIQNHTLSASSPPFDSPASSSPFSMVATETPTEFEDLSSTEYHILQEERTARMIAHRKRLEDRAMRHSERRRRLQMSTRKRTYSLNAIHENVCAEDRDNIPPKDPADNPSASLPDVYGCPLPDEGESTDLGTLASDIDNLP